MPTKLNKGHSGKRNKNHAGHPIIKPTGKKSACCKAPHILRKRVQSFGVMVKNTWFNGLMKNPAQAAEENETRL